MYMTKSHELIVYVETSFMVLKEIVVHDIHQFDYKDYPCLSF